MTVKSRQALFGFILGFLLTDSFLSFLAAFSGRSLSPIPFLTARYLCLFYIAFDVTIIVYLLTGWQGAVLLGSLYSLLRATILILSLAIFSPLSWLASGATGRFVSLISVIVFVTIGLLLFFMWRDSLEDVHKQSGEQE